MCAECPVDGDDRDAPVVDVPWIRRLLSCTSCISSSSGGGHEMAVLGASVGDGDGDGDGDW